MSKRFLLTISIFAIATTLTGCGAAGLDAPTRHVKQVTDGVETDLSSNGNLVYVRNLLIVSEDNGDANLVATIVNQKNTNDALLAISVAGRDLELGAKNYPVLLNKPVIFGGQSANATAILKGANLVAGNRVEVKLFLGIAGETTVSALVVDSTSPQAK